MARMGSSITYDCRPEFENLIFIEGLPGVGNVGKIAADFISYKLNSKRLASIVSSDLPAQVFVDENSCVYSANNELWYVKDVNGHDIIFLEGEFQGLTPQGQYEICRYIFDRIIQYDPKMIITLGGYGLGEVVEHPRVIGAVNDSRLKSEFEKDGVTFIAGEPQGGIVGAAALFLTFANEYDIDAACLMGETSGFIVDHKSASCVVDVLCKFLGIELDTSEMQEDIKQVEQINQEVQAMAETNPEDLSYFR